MVDESAARSSDDRRAELTQSPFRSPSQAPTPEGRRGEPSAGPPGLAERVARQLAGIDAWNASRPVRAETIQRTAASREQRLDALRRLASLERAHDALLHAVTSELANGPEPVPVRTAVIAHAHPWYARSLADSLARVGVAVLLSTNDAAEALGTVVAQQPDALVCGERLKMITGCLLLAEAALFSPHTLLIAQVDDGTEQMALGAGAAVTVLRRDPPADVVAMLIGLLAERP